MIIVTGGAGFIGANMIRALNAAGEDEVVVVDDLSDGRKFVNLVGCEIADYIDKDALLGELSGDGQQGAFARRLQQARAAIHMGACSSTTEWDGRMMMDVNYTYSTTLWRWCAEHGIPFIYASSASVYGGGEVFVEQPAHEAPLNMYGYSKYLFDQFVRRNPAPQQVVGLRFFNVYGPYEQHKGSMASVAWHFHQQLLEADEVRLFEGEDGYANGEQRRDFVYVEDVCNVLIWCIENPQVSGIFNVGTGRSQPFNDVARAVLDWHGRGQIDYIAFPEQLRGRYQSFTQADLTALRAAGYTAPFRTVEEGVKRYLDRVEQSHATRAL